MTETTEPAIISEALAVIDKGLADLLNRELVSSNLCRCTGYQNIVRAIRAVAARAK